MATALFLSISKHSGYLTSAWRCITHTAQRAHSWVSLEWCSPFHVPLHPSPPPPPSAHFSLSRRRTLPRCLSSFSCLTDGKQDIQLDTNDASWRNTRPDMATCCQRTDMLATTFESWIQTENLSVGQKQLLPGCPLPLVFGATFKKCSSLDRSIWHHAGQKRLLWCHIERRHLIDTSRNAQPVVKQVPRMHLFYLLTWNFCESLYVYRESG